MKYDPISRRFFLQGLGGQLLALPMLPSLLSSKALAQGAAYTKFFISVWGDNGQHRDNWYHANDSIAANTLATNIRDVNLSSIAGEISPVLGNFLDPYRAKLLLLRGLDSIPQSPANPGHCASTMLTGYEIYGGGRTDLDIKWRADRESIDQVLAYSAKVYSAEPSFRSVHFNTLLDAFYGAQSISWRRVGNGIIDVDADWNPRLAFDKIFGASITPDPAAEKSRRQNTLVVDSVLEDLNRLKANSQLSQADKIRLEAHVTLVHELQRRINVQPAGLCVSLNRPPEPNLNVEINLDNMMNDFVDLMVAAINCGATRIGTLLFGLQSDNMNYSYIAGSKNTGHHDLSHNVFSTQSARDGQRAIYRYHAQKVARLIAGLDALPGANGGTRLDDGLIYWGNAGGVSDGWDIHMTFDKPVLLAGSCGGHFKTGRFIDYRNRNLRRDFNGGAQIGIAYNRLLCEVMYAMGLSSTDFERTAGEGFGDFSDNFGYTYNIANGSSTDTNRYDISDKRAGLPFVRNV